VLLVGGAGRVGSFITPYLRQRHELRVLDLVPPKHDLEFVEGSVADHEALRRGLESCDSFIWLVMKSPSGGARDQTPLQIVENYTVNALGLHLLLFTAQELGIKRGVYTSTMTVHDRRRDWYPAEEVVPLDSPTVYGLTKGYGELTCQYFARWFDMNLIALRITGPRERDLYLEARRKGREPGSRLYVTDEEDLANAYLSALEAVTVGQARFDAVYIAGDEKEEAHNLSKAKRLLGWQPRSQRHLEAGAAPAL
jgi:nucleoside-diphosphate-sugar epimerase